MQIPIKKCFLLGGLKREREKKFEIQITKSLLMPAVNFLSMANFSIGGLFSFQYISPKAKKKLMESNRKFTCVWFLNIDAICWSEKLFFTIISYLVMYCKCESTFFYSGSSILLCTNQSWCNCKDIFQNISSSPLTTKIRKMQNLHFV